LRRLPAQKVIDLIGVKIYAHQKLWQAIPFHPSRAKKFAKSPQITPPKPSKSAAPTFFKL